MKLVEDGGFLVTCSCSHFMEPELLPRPSGEAAHGAHKRLRQVEFRTQCCDHPIFVGGGRILLSEILYFSRCVRSCKGADGAVKYTSSMCGRWVC